MSEGGWEPVDGLKAIEEMFDIIDVEMAQQITHPTRGRILRRLKQPHSAAELADRLDVPVTRLYHHIKVLESAELIRVVATRKVGAATERRYQAAARWFRMPEQVIEQADTEQLGGVMGSLFDLAKLDLVEFIERGGLSSSDAEQRLAITFMQIQLTPQRRADLIVRLSDLLKGFGDDAETDDTEPFNVFVAAFPPDD
jgi:DNA-binding transcriptional ArsR family regulator